jgi:hypothetical protein
VEHDTLNLRLPYGGIASAISHVCYARESHHGHQVYLVPPAPSCGNLRDTEGNVRSSSGLVTVSHLWLHSGSLVYSSE